MTFPYPLLESQYFLTLFPEFSKVLPATLDVYIDLSILRVPPCVWRHNARYGAALLTAHMLSTHGKQGGGSAGGPVTQEQVGDLSRSYQSIAEIGSGDAVLMTIRYGIDFVALRKETIVTASTVGGGRHPPYFPGRY